MAKTAIRSVTKRVGDLMGDILVIQLIARTIQGLIALAPDAYRIVTGADPLTTEQRIERLHDAIPMVADTDLEDEQRRQALEDAISD